MKIIVSFSTGYPETVGYNYFTNSYSQLLARLEWKYVQNDGRIKTDILFLTVLDLPLIRQVFTDG
jgi:hypothetical protein